MFTTVKRMLVFTAALGVITAIGLPSIHAEDPHKDHATKESVKAPLSGDPYVLSTDPISGAPLGDKPIIYQHEGRELRFTDQKSLDTFKADPAKYLPKVDELMVKQQTPFYPMNTCMVSGDKLGGEMGKAVDVIYKNRLVQFCCKDCVKDFQKDPAKYIAKLDEAVIAKQGPGFPMKTCMVSGDKLGGDMGKPVDMVIGNRLVRLCCADCRADVVKNPLKYLKMIDDASKKSGDSKSAAPAPKSAAPATKKDTGTDGHSGHQH